MKKKLEPNIVCLIFALKRGFGDSKSNLEAFRNFICSYSDNYEYMKPEDYTYRDIKIVLRNAFLNMLKVADYPETLYRNLTEHIDRYNDFYLDWRHGQDLTEDEKQAGDEIHALLETIRDVQIRKCVSDKHKCINGFTEALIKEAEKALDKLEKKFEVFKNTLDK